MKAFTLLLFPCLIFAQNYESDAAYAARQGDLSSLKILIGKLGVSPNAMFENSPLIFHSKNDKIARYLLSKGASSTAPDGRSMLMVAAGSGDKKLFAFFLKKNNARAKDQQEWTALHYLAAGSGSIDFAKKLLKAGADVNALDDELWTPLMHAAYHGNPSLTDYFIQAGAKTALKNKDKKTALNLATEARTFAVEKENFTKTAQLLKGASAK